MSSLRSVIDRVLAWLLVGLMGLAVLNVLWQVFTRWVLQDPSSYTEELARYLLIWVGILGSAYAAGQKMHLAIDLLPMKLQGRARHRLEIVIELMVFLFALVVMVVGGLRLVTLTLRFGQVSAALGLPLGYVYAVVPLSGLLMMYYAAVSVAGRLRALRGGEDGAPPELRPPQRTTTRPID